LNDDYRLAVWLLRKYWKRNAKFQVLLKTYIWLR